MKPQFAQIFFDEYRIIQSKIDKIAEFKFKVRGWSITLQTAILAGLFSESINQCFYLLAFLVPLFFHFLEQQQEELRRALSGRAIDLEYLIDRLSFDRCECERKKTWLDKSALKKVRGAPRISVTLRNTARQKIRRVLAGMLLLRTNFFYYFQYFVFFLAIILQIMFTSRLSSNETGQSQGSSMMEASPAAGAYREGKTMQRQDEFDSVEEELYSLVGRIDYGEISELDAYWSSLADGLYQLDFHGWEKPEVGSAVSSILASMTFSSPEKRLIKVASDMESLSSKASTDSMEKEQLEELRLLAAEFEELFLQHLKELKRLKEKTDD